MLDELRSSYEENEAMSEKEPDVLEMLIRHELAIKKLYEIFAVMFPNRKDFWQGLADDEKRHADWFGTLRSEETLEKWLLSDGRLKPQAIKSSIGYVESQIVRAQNSRLSLLQALSIANDLENALLEKQFSKIDESVAAEVGSVLMNIAAETLKHRKTIVEAIDAEKRLML